MHTPSATLSLPSPTNVCLGVKKQEAVLSPAAGLSVVLEYLTEDGLFSIDIALRPPPPPRRRQPARPAASRLAADAQPAVDAADADDPLMESPEEAVPWTAVAGQPGGDDSHDIPAHVVDIRSPAAGDVVQFSDVGEDRGPAAGGLLMLQPGFSLKGPRRWRPGRGGVLKSQPTQELRVSSSSQERGSQLCCSRILLHVKAPARRVRKCVSNICAHELTCCRRGPLISYITVQPRFC